uniref:DRBM domain-containing protein n=1 Tax=Eutreptiella gymnastica TaxID=73025 RepID=A0A7S1HXN0_9EUGL
MSMTLMNELCQLHNIPMPQLKVLQESPWVGELQLTLPNGNTYSAVGSRPSKKAARAEAAMRILAQLFPNKTTPLQLKQHLEELHSQARGKAMMLATNPVNSYGVGPLSDDASGHAVVHKAMSVGMPCTTIVPAAADPMSLLSQMSQLHRATVPTLKISSCDKYETVGSMSVVVNGKTYKTTAVGKNKREARANGARMLLKQMFPTATSLSEIQDHVSILLTENKQRVMQARRDQRMMSQEAMPPGGIGKGGAGRVADTRPPTKSYGAQVHYPSMMQTSDMAGNRVPRVLSSKIAAWSTEEPSSHNAWMASRPDGNHVWSQGLDDMGP